MTGQLLRIGLNLAWLRPGEVGGTEIYAERLIDALSRVSEPLDGRSVELVGIGSTQALHRVDPDGGRLSDRHEVNSGSRVARVVQEHTTLRKSLSDFDLDLVHHLGGTAPNFGGARSMVTIHDLQPLEYPENFSRLKRNFLARSIPAAVSKADLVVAPSAYVADQISDRFRLSPDRVAVVSVWAKMASPSAPFVEVELSGRGPFVLYPAMTETHKNHAVLFEAFRRARRERPELQLLCTGTRGTKDTEIRQLAASIDGIQMLGRLDSTSFQALLSEAEAVAYPSYFEGFGLPIIEAQAVGTVVYASSATCLPEVMGNGGRLIAPTDIDGWADALASPLTGQALTDERARGFRNAQRYSPERCAEAQREAYLRAVH